MAATSFNVGLFVKTQLYSSFPNFPIQSKTSKWQKSLGQKGLRVLQVVEWVVQLCTEYKFHKSVCPSKDNIVVPTIVLLAKKK